MTRPWRSSQDTFGVKWNEHLIQEETPLPQKALFSIEKYHQSTNHQNPLKLSNEPGLFFFFLQKLKYKTYKAMFYLRID